MAAAVQPKQLADTAKQLSKAIESGDSPAAILNIISPIQKWTATEDLLRQTKIGVAVAKLRTNKDPKIAETATRLVNKWKSDVKSSGSGARAKGSPVPGQKAVNGVKAEDGGRSSGASTPIPATKKEPQPKKYTVAPDKRNAAADGVKYEVTGNKTRDACVKLFYDGLAFCSEESPEDILMVARNVELAAYNKYQPETSNEYRTKMRSLFQNLKFKNNAWLRKGVYTGDISPDRFVGMSGDELKSQAKRESDAALERENMMKAMTAQEEKSISET